MQEIEIFDKFTSAIKQYYNREIKEVNCEEENVRDNINSSIEAEMSILVKEIIPPEMLLTDDDSGLMLINAVHFREEFLNHFRPQVLYSTPDPFYVTEGDIRYKINSSIEAEMSILVKEIIPPEMLLTDDDSGLMLINVVHFRQEFLNHFRPAAPYSTPDPFYVTEDDIRYVYMMRSDWKTEYFYETFSDYKVLGIEFIGGCTMFVVLPKKRYGLSEVLESLNGITLIKLAKNKKRKICHVKLPRFELNNNFDTKQIFQNLGVTNAFDPSSAEFSNLTANKSVFLNNILHHASITVFEKGDKSDFVYSHRSVIGTVFVPPKPKTKFFAEHPFLYFITDKYQNILFIGTVVDKFQPYADNISFADRKRNPLNPEFFKKSIHE